MPFVVSFSSEVDETALLANLVLLDHNYLGELASSAAPTTDRPMLSAQQPVVTPLYDTCFTSDVILALAQAVAGARTALPTRTRVEP